MNSWATHLLISLKDTLTALDPLWILRMTSIILFVSILGSLGLIRMAAGCSICWRCMLGMGGGGAMGLDWR